MSNQFKVTKYAAIASAVTLACGGIASAATISTATLVTSTKQANATSASTDDLTLGQAALTVVLSTTYAVNDQITLTLAGASFRTASPGVAPTCYVAGATASTLVMGFLSKTTNTATFRVTGGTGLENSSFTCTFPATGLSFTRNSAVTLGASAISIAYIANAGGASGTAFDSATAMTIGAVVNQFSSALVSGSGFSGTIDVNTNRASWTGGTTSRTLTFSVNSTSTNAAADSTVATSIDIYGPAGTALFSWLDDDGNGCTAADLTAGPGSATVNNSATLSISSNCATLSVTKTGLIGATTTGAAVTVTLSKATSSTGLAIQDGAFTVAPSFTVTQNSLTDSQAITAFSGGSFDINGSVINVPYVPYGTSGTSAITNSFYITNTSTSAGTVTATARNQAGTSCDLGTVGTAAARSVTNLSTGINNAIAACYATAGVFPDGTRVYISLISNTPAANTILNSTYNVGGSSRVNTINDSQRVKTN